MFFLLLVLLGTPIEGRNCSESNGGCDHYCIDRSDGEPFCGCQCYYQLNADNETCSISTLCSVDMLWMFDFAQYVMDEDSCFATNPLFVLPSDFTPFRVWRNTTASYMGAFEDEIDSGTYQIAVVVGGKTIEIKYQYGELQDAIAIQTEIEGIMPTDTMVCGHMSIFEELHDIIIAGELMNETDRSDAVRIAVVGMLGPFSTNDMDDLDTYSARIHDYFDQVFVISRLNTSFLSSSEATRLFRDARWLACRNGIANCPYLFYVDGRNDDNQTFSRLLINSMIDQTRCVSRRPMHEHTVYCGAGEVTITIPICLLGGLEHRDLQLNDPMCLVHTKSTTDGENLVITIPYDDCAWDQTIETIGGNEYVRYSQVITRRPTAATDSAKTIDLEASCQFRRYSEEELGPVAPIAETATGEVIINATFGIEFLLYPNDSYVSTSSIVPSQILVSERLYFSVEAAIPDDLKLILTDVEGRNTADGSDINYDVFASQCINDDTFVYEDISQNNVKHFSFEMFEFANTASSPNGEKDPVYFVVSVVLCPVTNTDTECTQACPARRKRGAENNGKVVKHTLQLGPFYLGNSDIPKTDDIIPNTDEVAKPKRIDRDDILVTIEMEDPSYMKISCLWIFITLVAILAVTSITKLLMKCSQNKSDKCKKAAFGENEMKNPIDMKPAL